MRLLYSLLLTFIALLLLPYFFYQALVNRKYLGNFRERLGLRLPEMPAGGRPTIWLHAVSVGETLAARPLCRAIRAGFPRVRLVVTTTTMTGQAVAHAQVPEADAVCYFPFDWSFSVRRLLDAVRPDLVILMESELWLNFLSECSARKIPVLVANGRISNRSFPRSLRFRFFVRRLYGQVTRFGMQSQVDAERAVALGAEPENVTVTGNIKYDLGEVGPKGEELETARELGRSLALSVAPLLVAGSTHAGEEEIVLEAFRRLRGREGLSHVRLLIAPRHPERFAEVERLIAATGLAWVKRSAAPGRERSLSAAVILLDSIGELATVYEKAAAVLIGGSLAPIGGHNILEPAWYGRPIVVGPHMENFRAMTAEFLRREALWQLTLGTPADFIRHLQQTWVALLRDLPRANERGRRARETIESNRGAAERTQALIEELLAGR